VVAIAAIAVLLVAGCVSGTSIASFTFPQDGPDLATDPDPDFKPNTNGPVPFFAAKIRNAEGNIVGELFVQVTTLDFTLDGVDEEDRL
jgi:hypothetical protein|tara:strand:- start:6214 stop:6477 length:264 start_codon:yes stop_codon:yes gene_type:complete